MMFSVFNNANLSIIYKFIFNVVKECFKISKIKKYFLMYKDGFWEGWKHFSLSNIFESEYSVVVYSGFKKEFSFLKNSICHRVSGPSVNSLVKAWYLNGKVIYEIKHNIFKD